MFARTLWAPLLLITPPLLPQPLTLVFQPYIENDIIAAGNMSARLHAKSTDTDGRATLADTGAE